MTTLPQRWEEKVLPEPNTGCWLWFGALAPNGYGQIRDSGPMRKLLSAHIVAWTLHRGPVPPGMCVCHKCDVRHCVNPEHLFLGTTQDNVDDMIRKGRHRFLQGSAMPNAVLTDEGVEAIRIAYKSAMLKDLAARHGVGVAAISHVVIGRTWKHAGGPIHRKRAPWTGVSVGDETIRSRRKR